MRQSRNDEKPDIDIDGKPYILVNLQQFRVLKLRPHLKGIEWTPEGTAKFKRWEQDKHMKPWEEEHGRQTFTL